MIGKGAQYLTAAGFGRYRITAASLGSLDLFGTVSGWLSKQARQAIMAAFGATDGKAVIRATNEYLNGIAASDLAKATALAANFNVWIPLYVPEDKDIMYSFVPTLGYTRWLKSTGTQYINTAWYLPDGGDNYQLSIHFRNYSTFSEQWIALCGVDRGSSGEKQYYMIQLPQTNALRVTWVNGDAGSYTPVGADIAFDSDHVADMDYRGGVAYCYLDGELKGTQSNTINNRGTLPAFLFSKTTNGTASSKRAKVMIAHFKIGTNNEWGREMYPFIRNNVNGMIDVINDVFYPNLGSGSFTISETPTP